MHVDTALNVNFQRARGRLGLSFEKSKGGNCLTHLHQSGCLKAMIPKNYFSVPDVVLINTAGGVTGGDHLQIKADIGELAQACFTTQTAERIYKSINGFGKIEIELDLEKASKLDWIPQETILFDKSAIKRTIKVNMQQSSHLLMLETIVLGRQAMGEVVTKNLFLDQWKITRDDRLIYMEALKLSDANELSGLAALGANKALATILYVAPDAEERLSQMRNVLSKFELLAAASAWDGKLVVRLVSTCQQFLRENLIRIITEFRGRELPKVWLM